MIYSSSFSKAHRKEVYHRLARVVRGEPPTNLLSFEDLRSRFHLFHKSYVGVQTIEVAKIIGTVERSSGAIPMWRPETSTCKWTSRTTGW